MCCTAGFIFLLCVLFVPGKKGIKNELLIYWHYFYWKNKQTTAVRQQSFFPSHLLVMLCDSSKVALRWQQDHQCRLNLHQFLLLLGDPEVLPGFLIPAASSEPTLWAWPSWTAAPEHHAEQGSQRQCHHLSWLLHSTPQILKTRPRRSLDESRISCLCWVSSSANAPHVTSERPYQASSLFTSLATHLFKHCP